MKFDYFLIFSSIILGLGISQIFEGFGSYLKFRNRHKNEINHSWTLSCWILVTAMAIFQYFAGSYQLWGETMTDIFVFATNLIIPILFFILCRIIIPDLNAPDIQDEIDKNKIYSLHDFFNRNRRTLSIVAIILIVCLAINFLLINRSSLGAINCQKYQEERLLSHLIFIILLFIVGFFPSDWGFRKLKFKKWCVCFSVQFVLSFVALSMITCLAIDVINKAIHGMW